MAEKEIYRVVISKTARRIYESRILEYLFKYFSHQRANSIDQSIGRVVESLKNLPKRGSIEPQIVNSKRIFRYLLHRESRIFEIKILYFIDEENSTVVITDFFPTSMDPAQMIPD